jgi:hypothetical protein
VPRLRRLASVDPARFGLEPQWRSDNSASTSLRTRPVRPLERRRPSPQEGWAGSTFFKMVDLAGVEAPTLRGESPRLPADVPHARSAPVAPRAADPGVRMGSHVRPDLPASTAFRPVLAGWGCGAKSGFDPLPSRSWTPHPAGPYSRISILPMSLDPSGGALVLLWSVDVRWRPRRSHQSANQFANASSSPVTRLSDAASRAAPGSANRYSRRPGFEAGLSLGAFGRLGRRSEASAWG